MTSAELKEYLKGVGTGITQSQLDKVAAVAMEAGYSSVWGAYAWKVKRRVKDTTTTAAQSFTYLPSDFDSIRVILLKSSSRPLAVDILEEEAFDKNFPKLDYWSNEQPFAAKIVYNAAGAGAQQKWQIYWFRIPDQAYNITIVYDARADLADLANLPSYMIDAIVANCMIYMTADSDKRALYAQVGEQRLQRAIYSDRTSSERAVQWGGDPGWDDWEGTSRRGSSVWEPLAP